MTNGCRDNLDCRFTVKISCSSNSIIMRNKSILLSLIFNDRFHSNLVIRIGLHKSIGNIRSMLPPIILGARKDFPVLKPIEYGMTPLTPVPPIKKFQFKKSILYLINMKESQCILYTLLWLLGGLYVLTSRVQ